MTEHLTEHQKLHIIKMGEAIEGLVRLCGEEALEEALRLAGQDRRARGVKAEEQLLAARMAIRQQCAALSLISCVLQDDASESPIMQNIQIQQAIHVARTAWQDGADALFEDYVGQENIG